MAKFTIRQRKDYTIEANSIEDALNILFENMDEIIADSCSSALCINVVAVRLRYHVTLSGCLAIVHS